MKKLIFLSLIVFGYTQISSADTKKSISKEIFKSIKQLIKTL